MAVMVVVVVVVVLPAVCLFAVQFVFVLQVRVKDRAVLTIIC